MSSLLKNFARVIDLEDRQVLFLKSERSEEEQDEEQECADAPYLLEARFYLLDGTSLSEMKLSFADVEKRDKAFDMVDEEMARGFVDQTKWMEDALLSPDDEDEDFVFDDDEDDPDFFGDDEDFDEDEDFDDEDEES